MRSEDIQLQEAVKSRSEGRAAEAIRQGADVDASGEDGRTALMKAAELGDEGLARMLMRAGADPDAKDGNGMTAGHIAAVFGNMKCLRALIDGGWDWRSESKFGMTAEYLARGMGDRSWAVPCVRALESLRLASEERGRLDAGVEAVEAARTRKAKL